MYSKDIISLVKRKRLDGLSLNAIAKDLKLSKSTVQYMIGNEYDRLKKTSGPKKKINEKVTAKICQMARKIRDGNQVVTARKVKAELSYDISIRSIQRTLSGNNFKYQSVERYMPLSKKHMQDRVNKASNWLSNCHPWERTIFTDEKRFNKDGPDNEMSWFDKRSGNKKICNHIKRQMKGGGIMVYGAITSTGQYLLCRVHGAMNGASYLKLLQEKVIPWITSIYPDGNYHYLQDNAPCHKAKVVMDWLRMSNVPLIEWPARSPDINVIVCIKEI